MVSVLEIEPFPFTNQVIRSKRDEPLKPLPDPGTLRTEELVPAQCYQDVVKHGQEIAKLLDRSERGGHGPQVAMKMRPERLHFKEDECLTSRARGHHWIQLPNQDDVPMLKRRWRVLQPSTLESRPSATMDAYIKPDVKALRITKEYIDDCVAGGIVDEQAMGWWQTGVPGPEGLDKREATIWYPHGGAIKNPLAFDMCAQKDEDNGFVSKSTTFPIVWPLTVDPYNIVVQHEKARMTIDKTIEQGKEPFAIKAYNAHVDLVKEAKAGRRVKNCKVSDLTRAAAIYKVSGADVDDIKYDLKCFFRVHDRQIAHAHQSGGITKRGYRVDWCSNFGEANGPDLSGRDTNCQTYLIRKEFVRLDKEYPSKDPKILRWLKMRVDAFAKSGASEETRWRWTLLVYILYFVDDAGLTGFSDVIHDSNGPITEISVDNKGVHTSKPLLRIKMYAQAAMAMARRWGHDTPDDKIEWASGERKDKIMVFLGIGLDLDRSLRLLSRVKRDAYSNETREMLAGRKMPNGVATAPKDEFDSLVHKLLHASEVIPLGRQHLFHCRAALKTAVAIDGSMSVLLDGKAVKELQWWIHNMAKSDDHGLPLASRRDFPTVGNDDHIITYHDASREKGNLESSGWGAWTIIKDVFYYIHGRWTHDEIEKHSINVLESKVRDLGTFKLVEKARALGCTATHSTCYNDNRTSEANAEFGRPGTELLHDMLVARQEMAKKMGLHIANERVASIDNDIADDLSRGAIKEALRFPRMAGMKMERVEVAEDDVLRLIQ